MREIKYLFLNTANLHVEGTKGVKSAHFDCDQTIRMSYNHAPSAIKAHFGLFPHYVNAIHPLKTNSKTASWELPNLKKKHCHKRNTCLETPRQDLQQRQKIPNETKT